MRTFLRISAIAVAVGLSLAPAAGLTLLQNKAVSGSWTTTGSLNSPRENHSATLLPAGKVLIAGGENSSGPIPSAELYDPNSGVWAATASLNKAREAFTSTLLPNTVCRLSGASPNAGATGSSTTR